MKELLNAIISKLVDDANNIKIDETTEGNTIKYNIKSSKDDIGKIVGKKGKNIKAVRTIMTAIGAKDIKKKIEIYVLD